MYVQGGAEFSRLAQDLTSTIVKRLFITGATGFVGRHLLQRLAAQKYETLFCLTRATANLSAQNPQVQTLEGSLADIDRYQPELSASDCVVHLAAATGKLLPADYFRINVVGTNNLIERAKQCGVKRVLFVSSVAARYPNKDRYYYAQSKEKAEQIVREGGMSCVIVRPTIVAGKGSGVMAGLEKIAGLPRILIFGDGRARVQPIAVEDLAEFLALILERNLFNGGVFEFGGPEVLTIEDLLCRICRARFGREPRVMHVPFGLVAPPLKLLEKMAYSLLPVTLGQLAVFRSDGVAESNALFEERRPRMKSIAQMLQPPACR
jgi:NADH dehydrogenase